MSHRSIKNYSDPRKFHNWRLPDISKRRRPAEYPMDNTGMLCLIPIFRTPEPTERFHLESWVIRSACWARRSWIEYTDIPYHHVKVGFYVGNLSTDTVFPILEKSGIDIDACVYVFDEAVFEDMSIPFGVMGKKMACFNDERFADYKWLIEVDADFFVASLARKRLDFFRFFDEAAPEELGAIVTSHSHPQWHIDNEGAMWWYFLEAGDETDNAQEWLRRASGCLDSETLSVFTSPKQPVPLCDGGLIAFPMRKYQSTPQGRAECQWIYDTAKTMFGDESVVSMWMARGKPFWNIKERMDIRYCRGFDQHVEIAEEEYEQPYFSQAIYITAESHWKQAIGAV